MSEIDHVLEFVRRHPGCRVADIAAGLGLPTDDVDRIAGALEARQLVAVTTPTTGPSGLHPTTTRSTTP